MEVRAAEWSEIDRDKALWNVPEGRMKGGEAHTVPLSAEALEILDTAAERQREGREDDAPLTGRIFPGATGGLLSDVAINKTLHAIMPGITAHGLGSLLRDWALRQRPSLARCWKRHLPTRMLTALKRLTFAPSS